MDNQHFRQLINKLKSFSQTLKEAFDSEEKLVTLLNDISKEGRELLHKTYKNEKGPITFIRAQVSALLNNSQNLLHSEVAEIIAKAKSQKPDAFTNMYRNWYNILYPLILIDSKEEIKKELYEIADIILSKLNHKEQITVKVFDFTGERETGSTRCWLAFYNNIHEKQTTAKQLFLQIGDGKVEFALYDRPNDTKPEKRVVELNEEFDDTELFKLFEDNLQVILNDSNKSNYWRIGTKDGLSKESYWPGMQSNNIICIGWSEIGDLNKNKVSRRSDIIDLFDSEGFFKNDNRTKSRKAGEILDFYQNLSINDIVLVQDGSNVLGIARVVGAYEFNPNSGFSHQRSVIWLKLNPALNNTVGLRTTFYKIEDQDVINQINKALRDKSSISENQQPINKPMPSLNQILYGPPGTGKTYNTINKSLSIVRQIEETDLKKEFPERKDLKTEFEKLFINDWEESKGQIAFTTFHQSITYEDFVEGIKPVMNGDKLQYQIVPGIFKQICSLAKNEWLEYKQGKTNKPSFEEAFNKLQSDWEEDSDMQFSMKTKGKEFTIDDFTSTSIVFKKASGTTTHSLSINTLRDYYYGVKPVRGSGVGIYYPGVLEKLHSYSSSGQKAKELKNYVLIIDEINRGNVANVLGELITLLEKDKRLGEEEGIEVVLPYSRESFGVPPNLYIIGTMNTADRSVEALDTALRRRFSFKEMMPEYNLEKLNYSIADHKANDILKTINGRIERLLNRDHLIGHSYFFKNENIDGSLFGLQVFYDKVIPLLQEYFFGDYAKIGLILGEGFVETKSEDKISFASFGDNDIESRNIYEIVDYRKEGGIEGFKGAIKTLMPAGDQ